MKINALDLFFGSVLVLTGLPLTAAELATDAPAASRAVLEPYPEQPEGPGDGGGVVMPTNIMDVAQFIETANRDLSRCANRPLSPQQCKARLDHAFSLNLLTQRAYDWALQNGYFPVVDTFGDYPEIGAVCKCGCFDPETLISARLNGVVLDVAAADITKQHQLLALQSDATRQTLHQDYRGINLITKGPEEAPLYRFVLSNGKQLAVTQHHGMVLNDGRVVAAKDVTTTDQFIAANGDVVAIDAIERVSVETDVVNFETHGDSDLNHIIVAEGVLVGDLVWQNQRAADLGRVTIRQ
jgi:hypothetical protein